MDQATGQKYIRDKKTGEKINYAGKTYFRSEFWTYSYTSFGILSKAFYKGTGAKRRKVIPGLVEEFLTPLALAIWIMDDGGWERTGTALHTQGFTRVEVEELCGILKRKYGLVTTIRENAAGQCVIRVASESMPLLIALVKAEMLPMFYYKLGIGSRKDRQENPQYSERDRERMITSEALAKVPEEEVLAKVPAAEVLWVEGTETAVGLAK